jgi:hypothetical protein
MVTPKGFSFYERIKLNFTYFAASIVMSFTALRWERSLMKLEKIIIVRKLRIKEVAISN